MVLARRQQAAALFPTAALTIGQTSELAGGTNARGSNLLHPDAINHRYYRTVIPSDFVICSVNELNSLLSSICVHLLLLLRRGWMEVACSPSEPKI